MFEFTSLPIPTARIEDHAALTRAAILAQTGGPPAFLERYGRLANGTSVPTGSSPEIGPPFVTHITGSGTAPTVQDEALTAADGTLLYTGSNIACPDGKISILVIAEVRANPAYTSGVTQDDLTFGIHNRDWTGNVSSFIASPGCIHAQLRVNGQMNANMYGETATPEDSGASSLGFQPPVGVPFPIRVTVEGEIVRFSALGVTRTYRDAGYASRVGVARTGFFVEWGGGSSSRRFLWHIRAIAVNAWELEHQLMGLCGEYGQGGAISQLAGGEGTASIQTKLRLESLTAFPANQGPQATDALAFPGAAMLGYFPYSRPGPTLTSRMVGQIARGTTELASAAPSADANLYSIPRLEASTSLAAGSAYTTDFYGTFGANSNTKRIKVVRSAGGATRFDSGDLSENGTAWHLRFVQFRTASGFRFMSIFETPSVRLIQFSDAAGGANDQLLVTGTAAGDVTVRYHETQASAVP